MLQRLIKTAAMCRPLACIAALVLALLTQGAVAQGFALPALSKDDAALFPAIGRLGSEGFKSQGCSGVLIAPDLVVTAAHCLPKVGPEGRVFAAGWEDGTFVAQARVATETPHPGYEQGGSQGPQNDVGLVVLSTPITTVAPIPLAPGKPGDLDGASVALIGYHKNNPHKLTGKMICPAIDLAQGQVFVACPVVQGNSGSPLLRQDKKGNWRVEAITAARMGPGAIAVYLPEWLHEQVAAHLDR